MTVANGLGNLLSIVGSIYHHHFAFVSKNPDVVVNVEVLTVQAEGAGGNEMIERGRHLHHHNGAKNFAPFHFVEGFLDPIDTDGF